MNAKLNDVWDMIDKLSSQERKIIYKRMNEDIKYRLTDVIDKVNSRAENDELTFIEITEEVEAVRKSRYEKN